MSSGNISLSDFFILKIPAFKCKRGSFLKMGIVGGIPFFIILLNNNLKREDMKRKNLVMIIIVFALISLSTKGQVTFQKTYGGDSAQGAYSAQQTLDGGYIIAGGTTSFGAGHTCAYLIIRNSFGDTLWTKTYGGANGEGWNSVQQTNRSEEHTSEL